MMDDYSSSSTNLGSKIRKVMEKCLQAFDIFRWKAGGTRINWRMRTQGIE
jgi:hypothetical protein